MMPAQGTLGGGADLGELAAQGRVVRPAESQILILTVDAWKVEIWCN